MEITIGEQEFDLLSMTREELEDLWAELHDATMAVRERLGIIEDELDTPD